jgi:farnesyl-diphosphate farnesyltransferase
MGASIMNDLPRDAYTMLQECSQSFALPINTMPGTLKCAVASAYLTFRAIDEIEDHPKLERVEKEELLFKLSQLLQTRFCGQDLTSLLRETTHPLPQVTQELHRWLTLAPASISPTITESAAVMAIRMAHWAANDWQIRTPADLGSYTYAVGGAVGLLMSELWAWYDNSISLRAESISIGQGLQMINMVVDREGDLARGFDGYPDGWTTHDAIAFARENLNLGDAYINALPPGPIRTACAMPLAAVWKFLGKSPTG